MQHSSCVPFKVLALISHHQHSTKDSVYAVRLMHFNKWTDDRLIIKKK